MQELFATFDEPNDLIREPRFSSDRETIVTEALRYDRSTMPDHVLADLAWYLVTTVGTPQTLRHYLPRIFEEILLRGGLGAIDWWILAGKLSSSDFGSWPIEQRRLVVAAMKLWIGVEIMSRESVTSNELPELAAEAIIHRTPLAMLFDMLDPYRSTPEPWWGTTWGHKEEVDFLVEAERACS